MIVYLHGFRSSPLSFKAVLLGQALQATGRAGDYLNPQLPASPRQAIELVLKLTAGVAPDGLTLIGSSLGGYYATWLAERLGCRAVLLNPAVKPPRELARYVGASTVYQTGEPFEFKQSYIAELEALAVARITRPQRYFLIAATGDEVLDWREMVAFYQGADQQVIDGSDHGMGDFAEHLNTVLAFCDGGAAPASAGAAAAVHATHPAQTAQTAQTDTIAGSAKDPKINPPSTL